MYKSKKGFTLIELLVVIAIISLLVSILLPSLQKAKLLAETVVCSNKLRNIGQAAQFYISENSEYMPYAYGGNAGGPWWWPGSWAGEYLDLNSAATGSNIYDPTWQKIANDYFACPSRDKPGSVPYYDTVCYGMNICMGMTLWSRQSRVVGDVSRPDQTIFQLDVEGDESNPNDTAQYYLTGQWWGNYESRHNNEAVNVLFIDSHLETVTNMSAVNNEDYTWDF